MPYCNRCGKEVEQGDAFCRGCGSSLGAGEPGEGSTASTAGDAAGGVEAGPGGAASAVPPVPPVTPPPLFPPPPAPRGGSAKTSGWAVASLTLGILSFLCLPFAGAVAAIVFGGVAKSAIKRSRDGAGGSSLATAGIVLGVVNLSILIVFAAVLVPWTIVNIGRTRTITRTVAAQGAENVSAELELRSGSLRVTGGADSLFVGIFTYNVKGWEPGIEYRVRQGSGELSVRQGGEWWTPTLWFIRNDWSITLSDGIPLDLSAALSSADADLDLRTLSVRTLDVDAGSGDVYADLSGDMPDLRRINIDGGSGSVGLDLKGRYRAYMQLEIASSSGDITVDLTGEWDGDLGAGILNRSGNITLILPGDVGARVRARTRSGEVRATGMTIDSRDGDSTVYINDAFRSSAITLHIDVEVSSGDIILMPE